MSQRTIDLRGLERVAARQHDVFTTAQAQAHGFSNAVQSLRRRNGDWVKVLPGVMRFASATPTFRMRCMAAALWSAPDGAVSHLTAGALRRVDAIPRPADTHVALVRTRRLKSDLVVVHRTADLLPVDVDEISGIRVTSALRTVLDIASMLDEDRLELAIEDCLRRGLFTVGQLEWRASLRRGKGVRGSRVIADLIRRHGSATTDSGWELRVEHVLRRCGFERPRRQVPVETTLGRLHVDLAYPGPPVVAFEYDSDRWHSGVGRRHADMRRRNALRAAGVTVIEVNAGMLVDRASFGALVRSVMGVRAGQL